MEKTPVDALIKFIQEENPTNDQIVEKLNNLKSVEENIVNRAYLSGFYDKESKRGQNNNYYKDKYGPDWFTNITKNIKHI
jgi:predicted transcriptional regulator